jgi:hypothetical protein
VQVVPTDHVVNLTGPGAQTFSYAVVSAVNKVLDSNAHICKNLLDKHWQACQQCQTVRSDVVTSSLFCDSIA